jgi:hypothetical protein
MRTSNTITIDLTDFRRPDSSHPFQLHTPGFPPSHNPLPDSELYDGFRVTISVYQPPILQGVVGVELLPLPEATQQHQTEFASSVEFGLSIHAGNHGWSFFDNV